ncbi:MAG: DUF1311 domain-containing protein, partial [Deltaproteobacteria bacterium]|nr:DUF1311 domain-containing protein [Deltaproteobacteria bacterium]
SFLSVRFGTYLGKATGPVEISLLSGDAPPKTENEKNDRTLARRIIEAGQLVDNELWTWRLPLLEGSGGFYLIIRRASDQGHPLAVWLDNAPSWPSGRAHLLTMTATQGGLNFSAKPLAGNFSMEMGLDKDVSLLAYLWQRGWGRWLMGLIVVGSFAFVLWQSPRLDRVSVMVLNELRRAAKAESQWQVQLELANREIESSYQKLMKRLDKSARDKLQDSQRAWLVWQEAHADFVAAAAQGAGPDPDLVRLKTKVKDAWSRADELAAAASSRRS